MEELAYYSCVVYLYVRSFGGVDLFEQKFPYEKGMHLNYIYVGLTEQKKV